MVNQALHILNAEFRTNFTGFNSRFVPKTNLRNLLNYLTPLDLCLLAPLLIFVGPICLVNSAALLI